MNTVFIKIAGVFFTVLFVVSCINNQSQSGEAELSSSLRGGFASPPDSVKPSVYWYWISDNISKEGVERDLEAIAEKGMGRAFIGNIGLDSTRSSYGDVKLMSDQWFKITKYAIRKASEVGIDIGLFNSPGWSQSGGPWIEPNQSMRYLANTELRVKGPQQYSRTLGEPAHNFEDVKLLAFKAPQSGKENISYNLAKIRAKPKIESAPNLIDGDTTTMVMFRAEESNASEIIIDIEPNDVFSARSLLLYPTHLPFKANIKLQAKQEDQYQTIKEFEFDRSNFQKTVGFKPFGPVTVSFSPVIADEYRLILNNMTGQGGFAEVDLSARPRVERYIEKQLGKMFQTPLPLWGSYEWKDQPDVTNDEMLINPSEVVDITDKLSEDGILEWEVPEGEWIVLRMGMVPTGVTNSPASPEGQGLEVDKINNTPLKDHFNAFVGRVQDSLAEEDRKALKWIVADSYETGSQNWTEGFAKGFQEEFGYDPLPWLPVLTGRVVESAGQSNRFLWDLRRLVADRVAYQYVGGLRNIANQHGLKLWLENYGHWGFPAEFLQYGGQADEVAGEFWAEGDLGSIETRAASSSAHIYGKNKVAAESFTAGGRPFARHPAVLKKKGDWSFAEGVNHTLLHVYIMQAYENRNPGMNAWFGTEFNRKNIWWDQIDLFTDYLRRSMFMLQQGKPVADVAYFIGEGAPKMTGIQEPELPDGYSFDYINGEVINNRLSVNDGKLVLPDGVSYDLLVLPNLDTMRPELLEKITNLVEAGANILGPRPERSPSLEDYPEADQQVQQMADELWGDVDGQSVKKGTFGQGKVMWGLDMPQALNEINIPPDFELSGDKPVRYTHRTMGNAEIYFVTNQSKDKVSISPTFRIKEKQPEFWDSVTGDKRKLPNFKIKDNRTQVPLTLEAYQSGFVVFEEPASSPPASSEGENFPQPVTLANVEGPWQVTFDSTRRGPDQSVTFDQLIDWKNHQNDLIKYYSGSAVYRTTFHADAPSEGENIYLNLGSVQVMGKVWVNGQYIGGAWTAPRRVDITNALQDGENKLRVEVVNTWVNRLIGDSRLPKEQRKTWAMVNDFTPQDELVPSGLLGPVRLQKINYTK